jgi:hypothetical protein
VRFIFNFVIPVARTARQMKKQMRDFQEKMNEQNQFHGNAQQTDAASPNTSQRRKTGDYIDFEEVK